MSRLLIVASPLSVESTAAAVLPSVSVLVSLLPHAPAEIIIAAHNTAIANFFFIMMFRLPV
jgi:hypothetical protein